MLYKYIGSKYKINNEIIVSNGDILTIKFVKDQKTEFCAEIKDYTITNNTTGKDIPYPRDFFVTMSKYLLPLDTDAGDIDEYEKVNTVEERVSHPSHYIWLKQLCGVEVIDITRHMDFDLGNAIKYILRCGHKEELGYSNKEKTIEDLRKAVFYINDKIEMLKRQ